MKLKTFALLAITVFAAAFASVAAVGQPTTGTVESHLAMAKVAAGDDTSGYTRRFASSPPRVQTPAARAPIRSVQPGTSSR
jgi:hypothetical protein